MENDPLLTRLQIAQLFLGASFVLTAVGIISAIYGALAFAVVCLVLAHGTAATGCYFHVGVKGYSPLVGIPIGVIFGLIGGLITTLLPDETEQSTYESDRRLAREGIENADRRDKGYEVLEDDDDD